MQENKKSSQVAATTSEGNNNNSWLYRRFEVINQEFLKEAETIIQKKEISRSELSILLKTYRIRNI